MSTTSCRPLWDNNRVLNLPPAPAAADRVTDALISGNRFSKYSQRSAEPLMRGEAWWGELDWKGFTTREMWWHLNDCKSVQSKSHVMDTLQREQIQRRHDFNLVLIFINAKKNIYIYILFYGKTLANIQNHLSLRWLGVWSGSKICESSYFFYTKPNDEMWCLHSRVLFHPLSKPLVSHSVDLCNCPTAMLVADDAHMLLSRLTVSTILV